MRLFSTLLIYLLVFPLAAVSQSIIKSAGSKSGILVGAQSSNGFTGITYDQSSDEFTFNYKALKQDKVSNTTKYPNEWSFNIDLGFDLVKNTSILVKKQKWQGGVQSAITIARNWNTTNIGKRQVSSSTIYYKSVPGGATEYTTFSECQKKEGKPCERLEKKVTNFTPNNLTLWTLFLTAGTEFDRITFLQEGTKQNDTLFVDLSDKFRNKSTITLGLNHLEQLNNKMFLSWAVSANFSLINRSGVNLESGNIVSTNKRYYYSKDSTQLSSFSENIEYYFGKPKSEFEFVPRLDAFLRYDLGADNPLIGAIIAYAPIASSLNTVRVRHNFSIGPSLSLPGLSDQVAFALISEWMEDTKGDTKFSITFHASFPLKIK